jgi:hypothetical protein
VNHLLIALTISLVTNVVLFLMNRASNAGWEESNKKWAEANKRWGESLDREKELQKRLEPFRGI